jgi:hypothetical protein
VKVGLQGEWETVVGSTHFPLFHGDLRAWQTHEQETCRRSTRRAHCGGAERLIAEGRVQRRELREQLPHFGTLPVGISSQTSPCSFPHRLERQVDVISDARHLLGDVL